MPHTLIGVTSRQGYCIKRLRSLSNKSKLFLVKNLYTNCKIWIMYIIRICIVRPSSNVLNDCFLANLTHSYFHHHPILSLQFSLIFRNVRALQLHWLDRSSFRTHQRFSALSIRTEAIRRVESVCALSGTHHWTLQREFLHDVHINTYHKRWKTTTEKNHLRKILSYYQFISSSERNIEKKSLKSILLNLI